MELDGKVALVTGAGSGIGKATALALREAGASVVAMDLSGVEESDSVAAAVGDVRSRDDVSAAVALARDRFGGLDVVGANAAVSIYEELEQQSEETIDLILDTNLKGALLSAQLAIPELKRRGAAVSPSSPPCRRTWRCPGACPTPPRRPGSSRRPRRSPRRSAGTASG